MKKALWIFFVLLAVLMGIYPFLFYAMNASFGITEIKSAFIMSKVNWKIGFHSHIVFGAIAILVGWLQFIPSLRRRNIRLHRIVGMIYLIAVIISGMAGIFISFYANGGISSFLALLLASICWLLVTGFAYYFVLQRKIELHRKLMIYSFALTFAGVTLRVWLPTLAVALNSFDKAYDIATWAAWVVNLKVAYFINEGWRLPCMFKSRTRLTEHIRN